MSDAAGEDCARVLALAILPAPAEIQQRGSTEASQRKRARFGHRGDGPKYRGGVASLGKSIAAYLHDRTVSPNGHGVGFAAVIGTEDGVQVQ
jgi:hypothetical protein